ncbi:N-acetyltransferase 9, partial [Basidiobolus meristosporus CBS 931.73]
MRKNENLVIVGRNVVLVPYKPEHVERYHVWMQSPFLQEMTASEPLSLEEEYEMQRTWHTDDDKCTFILLARPPNSQEESIEKIAKEGTMVGDINLFFNDVEDPTFAEIEIMIAEPDYRRRGLGSEALKLMMNYGIQELGVSKYQAKISLKNEASISLFRDKLGYVEEGISQVWQEIALGMQVDDALKAKLILETEHAQVGGYN